MWNKNISDLLDAVWDDTISLRETEEVSASRVKELALQKLRREQRGTGRRRRWPRKALAIAAVAAVLSGTALAAGVSQGWVRFFSSEEDVIRAASKSSEGGVAGYGSYGGADYEDLQSVKERADLIMANTGAGETVLAQAKGTPENGWTRMKTVEYRQDGRILWESSYQADRFSALEECWDTGLDLSWLEENYSPVPGAGLAILRGEQGAETPFYVSIVGEFRGTGDQVFNLQYNYEENRTPADDYILTQGEHEYYEVAEGVWASIRIDPTRTGKAFFWVTLDLGETQFYMGGTQLEMEEIQAILDHLSLAQL